MIHLIAAFLAGAGGRHPFEITPTSVGALAFGGTATGHLTFNTDGTTTYSNGVLADATGQWVNGAPVTGAGTGRYIRLVTSAGTLDGALSLSAGVWYEITSNRRFAVKTESVPDYDEWTGTAEISLDGGTTVVYSVSIGIGAESQAL